MEEIKVKIPETLKEDIRKIEREVTALISSEEKMKLLSVFLDNVMNGANQVSDEELVEFGRKIKKGRFNDIKKMGLVK